MKPFIPYKRGHLHVFQFASVKIEVFHLHLYGDQKRSFSFLPLPSRTSVIFIFLPGQNKAPMHYPGICH